MKKAHYVLLLLSLLILLSHVDRSIISLLVEPIKLSLSVSDAQMAILYGAAFAAVYALVGLVFGRLADVASRVWMIVLAVGLWSAATVGSGFATSYAMLLVLRVGVAVGEAVLSPCAASLIGDLFPIEQRPFATSVFLGASVMGAFGSHFVGGSLIALVDSILEQSPSLAANLETWRIVFVGVGLPGLVLAVVVALTMSEPRRRVYVDNQHASTALAYLYARSRLFGGLFFGVGLVLIVVASFAAWLPTMLVREFGWSASKAGQWFGISGMIGSLLGAFAVPAFAELWRRTGRPDALPLCVAFCATIGLVLAGLALSSESAPILLLLLGCAITFLSGAAALANVSIQVIVPPFIRGTTVAVYLLISTGAGMLIGPSLTVFVMDSGVLAASSLSDALAIVSWLVLLPALLLLSNIRGQYVQEAEAVTRIELGAASEDRDPAAASLA